MMYTGQAFPPLLRDAILNVMREIKCSKHFKKGGKGKAPMITADVERVVLSTPEKLKTNAAESSLWLLALHTGARAVTCSNVCLKDILGVEASSREGLILVHLMYRVTKGDANWDHRVTLEGSLEKKSATDFVYWFNIHLKQTFGIDLKTFTKIEDTEISETKIWGWSTWAMSSRLKTRARQAGYPKSLFSFHSLRAGFMCSAMIQAGMDASRRKAVLEMTALVAGWKICGYSQMLYVKEVARATIVASRLVLPESESGPVGVIDPALVCPESFHGIKMLPPKVPQWEKKHEFVGEVEKRFMEMKKERKEDKTWIKKKCWEISDRKFVEEKGKQEEVREMCQTIAAWKNPQTRFREERHAEHRVMMKYMCNQIDDGVGNLMKVVDDYLAIVRGTVENEFPEQKMDKRRKKMKIVKTEHKEKERTRRYWTAEEDEKLKQGVEKGLKWRHIAVDLEGRSPVDCKDRFRNIKKKEEREKEVVKS